jgi:hypothetical protein
MAADARVIDMSDLKDLEPLSKRLNAASNELNQTLQTIQDRLNALGIGLEVWVSVHPLAESDYRDVLDDNSEPTRFREFVRQELGYGRLGDGWALLVRSRRYVEGPNEFNVKDTEVYEDDTDPRPLLKASRELRVAAVPLLPKLVEAIEREAKVVIERVEQAKKIADSLK